MPNNQEDLNRKLNYLNETKQEIKKSLKAKGQPVNDNTTFREYANLVNNITTGTDTNDATATADDILNPKTAYIKGQKVTGTIETSYDTVDSKTYIISDLSKSLSYNFGLSEDGLYLADLRKINSVNTLCIYKRSGSSINLVASTTSNLPGILNPDLKFSPIVENNIYRLMVSAGAYTCVYNFDGRNNTINFLVKTYLNNYTSNSIYMICCANKNKNVFTVVHTNLNDWGYGPVATAFLIDEENNSYSTLWSQNVSRWQAGHFCTWSLDDLAFCYNSTHEGTGSAGYLTINPDYTFNSKNSIAAALCYIDPTHNHRISDKNLQTYNGTTWKNIGKLPSIPSDPDFVCLDNTNKLMFIGSSTTNTNNVYIYEINWSSGGTILRYTLSVPTDHMYFGSNNGSQINGIIGFNKSRTLIYNRRTTPTISSLEESNIISNVIIAGNSLYALKALENAAVPSNVLINKEYYNEGGRDKGTMPNNGTLNITPGVENQSLPLGYIDGGIVKGDENLVPENIIEGKTIFGVQGNATGSQLRLVQRNIEYPEGSNIEINVYDSAHNRIDLLGNNSYLINTNLVYIQIEQNGYKYIEQEKSITVNSYIDAQISELTNILTDDYENSNLNLTGTINNQSPSYSSSGTLTFNTVKDYKGLYTNGSSYITYSLNTSISSYDVQFDFYKANTASYSRVCLIQGPNYEIEIKGSSNTIYWDGELSGGWIQNQWNTLKLHKEGNRVQLYINNKLIATKTYSAAITGIRLGRGNDSGNYFTGYYKNVVITDNNKTPEQPIIAITPIGDTIDIIPKDIEQQIAIPEGTIQANVSAIDITQTQYYEECLELSNQILGN